MGLHGAPGEVEEAGDLRVRAAVGGQAGDAQLASGEGAGAGAGGGGAAGPARRLSKSALPHRILATITGKDGRTTSRRLALGQGAGPQRRAFRIGEVSAVRFTIESAYGISGKKQVAIAEIEFSGPSSANNT